MKVEGRSDNPKGDHQAFLKNKAQPVFHEKNPNSPTAEFYRSPGIDVLAHRMRHLEYHPSPILSIAVCNNENAIDLADSQSSSTAEISSSNSWLAVSRDSGRVDLLVCSPKMRTVACVAGSTGTPLSSLVWTNYRTTTTLLSPCSQRPVLLGVSGSDVHVVDFWGSNRLVGRFACDGGTILCTQALKGGVVALGCRDGTIRLLLLSTLVVNGKMNYQMQIIGTLPSSGASVLSLALRPHSTTLSKSSDQNMNIENVPDLAETVLYCGIADGTIRRYDCLGSAVSRLKDGNLPRNTWRATLRMTVECHGRATPTRVWTLKALSDDTVISGDSLGQVQFWDGSTGTLISSFEHSKSKADVLSVSVSADECRAFCVGIDSRVVCIQRAHTEFGAGREFAGPNRESANCDRWMIAQTQRPHSHDVKAAGIIKKRSKRGKAMEILVTGGLDTKLCTFHVAKFLCSRPRNVYPWPPTIPVNLSPKRRILSMMHDRGIELFSIAPSPENLYAISAPVQVKEVEQSSLGCVDIASSSNLVGCTIACGGEYLALCDSSSLFLFRLQVSKAVDRTEKSILPVSIPVHIPPTLLKSSAIFIVALKFVDDRTLALATSDGCVHILRPSVGGKEDHHWNGGVDDRHFFLSYTIPKPHSSDGSDDRNEYLLPIHSIVGSPDGMWFATMRSSTQDDGKIEIYGRKTSQADEGEDSSYHFWWSLPALGNAVTAATFFKDQNGVTLLGLACVDYALYLYDVEGFCLHKGSQNANDFLKPRMPHQLTSRHDYPVHICVKPAFPWLIMMASYGALVTLNTSIPFPQKRPVFPKIQEDDKKRKRKGFDGNEIVIVEQPWQDVAATFSLALERQVYGV